MNATKIKIKSKSPDTNKIIKTHPVNTTKLNNRNSNKTNSLTTNQTQPDSVAAIKHRLKTHINQALACAKDGIAIPTTRGGVRSAYSGLNEGG